MIWLLTVIKRSVQYAAYSMLDQVEFCFFEEMNNILEIGDLFKKGSPEDMKHIDDDQTASDNRDALKAFFQKFPQYLDNGLFVSGESYAGIYVPTLIAKIVDDPVLMPHFKGRARFFFVECSTRKLA